MRTIYIHQVYGLFEDNKFMFDNELFKQSYLKWNLLVTENNNIRNNYFNYVYKLWDKKSCEELIDKYPDFYYYYDVKYKIMKADIIRFLILYEYGGIYSDLDVIPNIKSIHFLSNKDAIDKIYISKYINKFNLWDIEVMGVMEKNNKILYDYLLYIPSQITEKNNIKIYDTWVVRYVFQTTGPRCFNRFIKKNKLQNNFIELKTILLDRDIKINDKLNISLEDIHFISYHSLSYNPHGNKNIKYRKKKKNKIAIITWYNDKIKEYADKFSLINKKYCDKNNYDYIVGHKEYIKKGRSPAYNKIPYILDILNTNKYDYVIWIDADAHFRKDEKIEKYITNEDFIFCGDLTCPINTGFIICKNTDYTKQFLDYWINIKVKNPNPEWWEQGFLKHIYNNNLLDIKSHCKIIPHGELQDFKQK